MPEKDIESAIRKVKEAAEFSKSNGLIFETLIFLARATELRELTDQLDNISEAEKKLHNIVQEGTRVRSLNEAIIFAEYQITLFKETENIHGMEIFEAWANYYKARLKRGRSVQTVRE